MPLAYSTLIPLIRKSNSRKTFFERFLAIGHLAAARQGASLVSGFPSPGSPGCVLGLARLGHGGGQPIRIHQLESISPVGPDKKSFCNSQKCVLGVASRPPPDVHPAPVPRQLAKCRRAREFLARDTDLHEAGRARDAPKSTQVDLPGSEYSANGLPCARSTNSDPHESRYRCHRQRPCSVAPVAHRRHHHHHIRISDPTEPPTCARGLLALVAR